MEFQQVYKKRSEAWRLFCEPLNVPISQAKFYRDMAIQPDKSVLLCDLLAYVVGELKFDVARGRGLAEKEVEEDRQRERRLAELELRKAELDVAAKERSERKDGDKWMERVDHDRQMAAFALRVDQAQEQQEDLHLPELVHACGGDPSRAPELRAALAELRAAAMNDAVRVAVQTVVVEEDDTLNGESDEPTP